MTMDVRELLPQAVLDMSGHASGNSTPKSLNPVVLLTPLPAKPGDFPRPVDTSYHVSILDDIEMRDVSLAEIPAASSPTSKKPGPSRGTLPQMQAISEKRPTRLWRDC